MQSDRGIERTIETELSHTWSFFNRASHAPLPLLPLPPSPPYLLPSSTNHQPPLTTMTSSSGILQSRTLALLLKGMLEKHNKTMKFNYLLELVRSLRHLVQRAAIMHTPDDLTSMILINTERYISCVGFPSNCTLHSILFTSFAITAKFWEDDRLFNSHIAPACGMKLDVLNQMEVIFLTTLKFEVTVNEEQVTEFYNDAKRRWEGRASVASPSSPSSSPSSFSRFVSSFLHSNFASSPSTKPCTRTVSSPAITFASPSSSSISRAPASRTISTPNFGTASSLSPTSSSSPPLTDKATPLLIASHFRSSPLATSHAFTKPQRSHSTKDIGSTTKRLEKASSKIMSFFRARDE